MPKHCISVPVSDETAEMMRVGREVRITLVGQVEEVRASSSYPGPVDGPGEVWPAEIRVEVSSAKVVSADMAMEKLMEDEE